MPARMRARRRWIGFCAYGTMASARAEIKIEKIV